MYSPISITTINNHSKILEVRKWQKNLKILHLWERN